VSLPQLERALILAKRSNVECVVEMVGLTFNEIRRYYVLPTGTFTMVEARDDLFATYPKNRRWTVAGDLWRLDAKVIDVESGAILAVALLYGSPLDRAQSFELQEANGVLRPQGRQWGMKLDRPEDSDFVGTMMLDELAREVRGDVLPTDPASSPH
jgi:hypothetical protein